MINVSDEFKEVLANGGQLYMTVDVEYADGTTETWDDEIMQGQNAIVDGAESATFPMGVAIEKYMTLCIDNRYDEFAEKSLYMAVLRPRISLQLDEEPIPTDPSFVSTAVVGSAKTSHKTTPRVETVRRGKFTVTTPETYGEIINLTAVDDMYKADQPYYTNFTLPQPMYTLVREACDICGIPMGFSSMTHGGYIVNTIPEDITFRTFLAYAAMIECANARIDIYGNLQFIKWDFHSYKGSSAVVGKAIVGAAEVGDDGSSSSIPRYVHQIEDFKNSPTFSSDDVVVTGVLVKTRKEEYQFGNDGYVLEFENLLAEDGTEDLATIATWLGEKLIGATFRTMTGDVYSDPTIEFGDSALSYRYVASLGETREYLTPITDVSFYLQGYTTIKTQATDPIRLSSTYNTEAARAFSKAKALTDEAVEEMGEAIEGVNEAVEDEAAARAAAIEAEAAARAAAIQSVEDATNAAIERLAERLAESSGLYMTVETQPDGSSIYYMHNKPTLAESDIIWKLTAEAFAISTDYGETYPYGFTVDGEVIARILSTEGINASWINTGAIIIKNDSGGVMFQADMDLNSLLINTEQFVLDSAGNATFSGELNAPSGKIGGWIIESGKFCSDPDKYTKVAAMQSPSDSITWVFAAGGTSNSSYSDAPFRVDKSGNLYATSATVTGVITATSGKIGNWLISGNKIYNDLSVSDATAVMQMPASGNNWTFAVGGASHDGYSDCPFRVSKAGAMYSTSGNIGGWTINSTSLYNGPSSTSSTTSGTILSSSGGVRHNGSYGHIRIYNGFLLFGHNGSDSGYISGNSSTLTTLRLSAIDAFNIASPGIGVYNAYADVGTTITFSQGNTGRYKYITDISVSGSTVSGSYNYLNFTNGIFIGRG